MAAGASAQPVDQAESGPPADQPTGLVVEVPRSVSDAWKRFSELALWEDGMSEMCYYDATCDIYGTPRRLTRVHLMNREFLDERRWVKADENTTYKLPVFKMAISEEVPTENFNYRFLTVLYLERPSLEPLEVTVSSQEWCGTTFKQLQWSRFQELDPQTWSMDLMSFSYFPGEGDAWTPFTSDVDAYECLYLFARAVVAAGGEPRPMHLLRSLRSNRAADPHPLDAVLKPEGEPRDIRLPAGKFRAQRVVLDWKGEETWFDVAADPPFQLLAYQAGDVKAELRFTERRAYWDPKWKSGFYKPGQAP